MNSPWKRLLRQRLPALGHRNWIGVVDAAYPLQTAPGIEMVATGAEHFAVLKHVLDVLKRAPHVRPRVMLDRELRSLPEAQARGITGFRDQLAKTTQGRDAVSLPHEEIIVKLDTAARLFHILLLKTTLLLPYTSVFIELDCGYWSDEAERDLRTSLKKS